jgi:hypothetical protein
MLKLIHISCFSQGNLFSINLPLGYGYSTESTVNFFIEQEFMGIRYNTKMEVNNKMNFKVLGLDADSNYIISGSYQRMDIHVSSLLINMEVNSESTLPGDSLSIILHSMTGKEFRILLSRKGIISDVSGLDEFITETISSSDLPKEQKSEFTRNLIQSLGEDVLLDSYGSNQSFYPGYPVAPPAEWNYICNLSKSGIPLELNSVVRLKSNSRNISIMISEGKIGPQNIKKDEDNPGNVNNVTGNEVSEIKMDIKTGLIVENITSQNISGTLRTPSETGNAEENLIPFKIASRRTTQLTPLR